MTEKIRSLIQRLDQTESTLFGRDPLLTWEQSAEEISRTARERFGSASQARAFLALYESLRSR